MKPLYSHRDFLLQFCRQILPPVGLMAWQGVLKGAVLAYMLFAVYYLVLRVVWKLEPLAALDEFFLLDNEKNRANILCVIKTDKFPDYDRLRGIIIKLAMQHPRLKHSLKKLGGQYFFAQMSPR